MTLINTVSQKLSSMVKKSGKARVIISNVSPQIEEGTFPAKSVIDESVIIAADIFSDGHDVLYAEVLIKHDKDRRWQAARMEHLGNDKWEVAVPMEKTGFYKFKLQAWIDHFTTWQLGLQKKHAAGQDIALELKIGAELVEKAMGKAASKDKAQLKKLAAVLKSEDVNNALEIAMSHELASLMHNNADTSNATLYPKVLTIEAERKKAGFSSWYEFFPRSAAVTPGKHGTFKDAEKLLPRVAEMGFDVLYFPPIHPIGESKRKGRNNALEAGPDDPGSPWAIGSKHGGHKAIHPELGSLKDFKSLVKAADSQGIEIALDIAYQCAPDHPYVKEHPQWFKWRPDGSVQYAENPPKKYEDILPINFESEDWENLWEELKSVLDYWIAQGVSIFRIDNPHTKAFPFWEWAIASIREKHPEILFLAEAFTRPRLMERLAKVGFNQSYTYFTWRNTSEELIEYMEELTQTDSRYIFRPNFWPNTPDILPPHLTYGGENAHILRVLLAGTLSSNYGIYGPVYEFGINTPHPSKEEYIDNEKYELKHWDWGKETRIKEIITMLNKIRKDNPALQTTWNFVRGYSSNENLLCFGKYDKASGNTIIVAANLDPYHTQQGMVSFPVEKLGLSSNFTIKDLLSGDTYEWHAGDNYVALNPYDMPMHIFEVIK